jgi:hypothetical protein
MHVPEMLAVGAAASGSLEATDTATLAPAVADVRLVVVVRRGGMVSTLSSPRLIGLWTLPALSTAKAYRSVSPSGGLKAVAYWIHAPGRALEGAAARCGTNW